LREPGKALGVVQHRQVQATGLHPFLQRARQRFHQVDADQRIALQRRAQQRHRQHRTGGGRQSHDNAAGHAVAARANHPRQLLQALQHVASVQQQLFTGLGRTDPAGVAGEQLNSQGFLDRLHVPAEGRLRNVQPPRRLGEATELGNGHEVAQFSRIHGGHALKAWMVV